MKRIFRRSTIHFPVIGILASLFADPALAQLPQDGWAWTGDYIDIGLLDSSFSYMVYTAGGFLTDIAADGDGGSSLYASSIQYLYDPQNPNGSLTGVASLLASGEPRATYLAEVRRFLYFMDYRNGSIGRCRKGVANQTGTFLANPLVQLGISGVVSDVCSNGRDLFFSVDVTGNDAYHIFAVDLQKPNYPARPVASLPVGTSPRRGPSLAIGRDGILLAMDDPYLYRIDSTTGAVTQLMAKPSLSYFATQTFSPDPWGWQILMAYNPWTDVVAVIPKDMLPFYPYGQPMVMCAVTLTGGSWQAVYSFPWGGFNLTSTALRPFELFGVGCANVIGRDPRLGWQGLPRQGQSFSITLRDAETNGFAVFWMGFSDTNWAAFQLPWDAGPLGAPGCSLLVSPDVPFAVAIDPNGQASLSVAVPVNPSLGGLQVFAQTASSTTVNALGFASSDAVVIRVR